MIRPPALGAGLLGLKFGIPALCLPMGCWFPCCNNGCASSDWLRYMGVAGCMSRFGLTGVLEDNAPGRVCAGNRDGLARSWFGENDANAAGLVIGCAMDSIIEANGFAVPQSLDESLRILAHWPSRSARTRSLADAMFCCEVEVLR